MGPKSEHLVIAANLKALFAKRKVSQLQVAKALDMSPSTLNSYFTGRVQPSEANLEKIADYFGVKQEAIDPRYAEDGMMGLIAEKMLPVMDWKDGELTKSDQRYLAQGRLSTNSHDSLFYFEVSGDDMSPLAEPGTYILVDRDQEAANGDYVCIVVGERLTFRRRLVMREGYDLLVSFGDDTAGDKVIEYSDAEVIGKVVGIERYFA
ncbi:XRE family transcriptional regulator [Aerococcus sanguinicola]